MEAKKTKFGEFGLNTLYIVKPPWGQTNCAVLTKLSRSVDKSVCHKLVFC